MQQRPHPAVIGMIKTLIATLLIGSVAAQAWLLPAFAEQCAVADPQHAALRIPYLAVCIAVVLGFEIAMVAVWRLLSMTASGQVFSDRALRWVDLIIWCAAADTVLAIGLLVHMVVASVGPFMVSALMAAGIVFGVAFTLLMLVMRGLLIVATSQHDELEAVI